MSLLSKFKFSLTGQKALRFKLSESSLKGAKASGNAMYLLACDIMRTSKAMTPVKTGVLQRSGYVTKPRKVAASTAGVEIGYGGPAEKYAVIQHERTDYNHPGGGESKFLEKAMDKHLGVGSARVAAFLSKLFETSSFKRRAVLPSDIPTSPWGN